MKIIPLICILALTSLVHAQPELNVIWDRSGETDSSSYGTQILPLGDQNNDGYADWAVMAWGNRGYHGTQDAYLEFFHGGNPPPTEPYFTFRPDSVVYEQSWEAFAVGDVNGDGYQDWMLRLWPRGHPAASTVAIFFGGPGAHDIPDLLLPITSRTAIYPIGDFNGDGYSDIFCYDEQTQIGRMYFGGSPMDTLPDWVLHGPPAGIGGLWPYALGDFNGDGASDFLCYNPNAPYHAAVFLGGAQPDTVPAYSWTDFPWPIGGVKSINGDAADEMLFAAPEGADVHFGRATLVPAADTRLNSGAAAAAVSAGDFNRDGYNDLLMFTEYSSSQVFGSVDLHLGHGWLNPEPAFEIEGLTPPLNLYGIWTAAGLGDVNGDGVDDIAIGSHHETAYLGWRGRCIIIAGDTSLVATVEDSRPEIPERLSVSVYPNPFNGDATIRLQVPPSTEPVTLTTFNVLGQQVQRAIIPPFSGQYLYHYDGASLSTGIYFLRVQSGRFQITQKLMLLR
jgi:hypothetical protein